MKIHLILIYFLIFCSMHCQNDKNYDKRIVEKYSSVNIIEASFMVSELIEIYKKDSLIINKIFNKDAYNRTKYTIYCYNICADYFSKKLTEKINADNKEVINKILLNLSFDKNIIKPSIDWSNVFRTCLSCPFGEFPDERFFYFQFSLIFMGESEIKEMIRYENGKQWAYALMAIKEGDAFTLNREENYVKYVLDRRIASFIIEKWKDSEINELKELLAIYRSLL